MAFSTPAHALPEVRRLATFSKALRLIPDSRSFTSATWQQEAAGSRWWEFVHADDLDAVAAWLRELWAGSLDFRLQVDGEWLALRCRKTPEPGGWALCGMVLP